MVNDKADDLATIGMHQTKPPRQLNYRQIVSHHYDKAEERRQAEKRAAEQEQEQEKEQEQEQEQETEQSDD